ncbi:hypothetical protein RU97_GL001117 [Enterococcus canis]|uniref:Uncharacterized protein n=1 Tax=Enterococcus canis TaxID=214095 RepID=A0A1L8RIG4_9ENTE|nr:hypothetical protein RU97_GL001117 [Enterococcus canis]
MRLNVNWTFFTIGLAFLVLGLSSNQTFLIVGMAFLILSFIFRKKTK